MGSRVVSIHNQVRPARPNPARPGDPVPNDRPANPRRWGSFEEDICPFYRAARARARARGGLGCRLRWRDDHDDSGSDRDHGGSHGDHRGAGCLRHQHDRRRHQSRRSRRGSRPGQVQRRCRQSRQRRSVPAVGDVRGREPTSSPVSTTTWPRPWAPNSASSSSSCHDQFDSLLIGLEAGNIDVIMSSMYDDLTRQKQADFVDYAKDGTALLVAEGQPREDRRLAGSVRQERRLREGHHPGAAPGQAERDTSRPRANPR